MDPNQPSTQSPYFPVPPKRNNKPLIVGIVVLGVVLLSVAGLVLLSDSSKKTPTTTQQNPQETTTQEPQAATAVGIEQINSSISQDMSGLNDDRDFPAEALSDKSLGL